MFKHTFCSQYCGEFTVLGDVVVTAVHVTAIWLSRDCQMICAFELKYWNDRDVLTTADQYQVPPMPPCVHTRPTDEDGQDNTVTGVTGVRQYNIM